VASTVERPGIAVVVLQVLQVLIILLLLLLLLQPELPGDLTC
jgi:hypothetical protein